MAIPTTQKAAIKVGSGHDSKVEVRQIEVPKPGPGQILVKINYTGLCASDKSLIQDEWSFGGVAMMPVTHGIAGHEGAGVVVDVADDVKDLWKVGDRAGIKWIVSVCGKCEFCTNGKDEVNCPNQINSGFSIAGTFQQYAVTDAKYASRLPEGVTDEEAGPIMCGGVTAYVACKRSEVRPGQWIVIPGAGGGLGHLAVQYAKAMGMRVIAVDGGDAKRDLCLKLGAEKFIDFQKVKDVAAEVMKITTYGAHGVVITAATKAGYDAAPTFLRPDGTMVAVGLPKDPTVIAGAPPIMLCLRKLKVVGSVVGNLKDVEECLDFTARGLVHPILTIGHMEDLNKYIGMMNQGTLVGRCCLKVSDD